jgi:hypothetical protein
MSENTIGPPVRAKKIGGIRITGGDLIGIRARTELRLGIFVNRSPYRGRIGNEVNCENGGSVGGGFGRD